MFEQTSNLLRTDKKAGLHATRWDLRGSVQRPPNENTIISLFKRFDADKDGKLTKMEAPEGQRGQFLRQLISRADKNEDGAVSLSEFKAAAPPNAGPTGRNAPSLNRAGRPVKPGNYVVSLKVDGEEFMREIKVAADPEFPTALLQEELEEQTLKQRQEFIE